MENKKYIVFVSWGNDTPVVVSSLPTFDSEYNVFVEVSDILKNAIILNDSLNRDKAIFKAICDSFKYNKDYKVKKYFL